MQIKTSFQYFLPQHLLSRLIGKLAKSERVWLKNFLIDRFIKYYQIDMDTAIETAPHKYPNFNSLFTRALKPNTRPINTDKNAIISPVDARISQFGTINNSQLIQAKGSTFNLYSLLGIKLKDYADKFAHGNFITLYLSPSDYHRVHMPYPGQLLAMSHIPGKLFSVNNYAVNNIPQLFARNERMAAIFATKFGPIAIIMVGAMLVASIETVWTKAPISSTKKLNYWDYSNQSITFARGEEIGRFQFGSTVILIFPDNSLNWSENIILNSKIKMGEKLAVTSFEK